MYESFRDGFIGIGERNVFAHQSDGNFFSWILQLAEKIFPLLQVRLFLTVNLKLCQHALVKLFLAHQQRHIIDRIGINGFDNRIELNVAE